MAFFLYCMDLFVTGILLGFFLSFMIGPVFFILIETSITKGFKAALTFDAGVIIADICFILIAYFSSFQLINSIKDDPALFLFGGMIMITYGIISFVRLQKLKKAEIHIEATSYKNNYFSLFAKGFLLNFINVGVLGFWLTIIITIGPQLEMNHGRMINFFAFVIGAYLLTDIFKMLLAKQLQSKLTPKNILKVKKISCVLLVIFGLVIMSKSFIKSEIKIPKTIKEHQFQ
ncbi:Threonine/homoserine/homoserine lactone efflux protein [Paenimyroides ummariense]|uniref:Threonine/homoserine/homoserine lactone efflux protein n=2 Tax=Paenimyroides ummariense TaxID=913024 RepID=A0A1I4ZBU9_9FLAO|nr:Threonine/homoserine/homoserine lactone efflux protein [Paenimyroides ummariense]